MIITEREIREIVRESIVQILSEGISDVTYHFTSLQSCIKILSKDAIYLTMSSNKSDTFDGKRLFYLSTQRGRNSELGYAGSNPKYCARIQLNGRMLMTKYKGMPIDYWGASMGKPTYYNDKNDSVYGVGFTKSRQTHHHFEMEDRIVSFSPVIENASKYITRIDVYIDPEVERLNNEKIDATTIYVLCRDRKIPFNCYMSLKDFNSMTDNTINGEIVELDNNYYKLQKTKDSTYQDSDLAKASGEKRNRGTKADILCELFNILTGGMIGGRRLKPQHYKLIVDMLQKYGLQEYKDEILKRFTYWGWGHRASESCDLLANTSNTPIRKLNHEIGGDDSIKIMKFGADVLRHFGVSNFNDLALKLENKQQAMKINESQLRNIMRESLNELSWETYVSARDKIGNSNYMRKKLFSQNGFSRNIFRKFLKKNGFSDDEIRDALNSDPIESPDVVLAKKWLAGKPDASNIERHNIFDKARDLYDDFIFYMRQEKIGKFNDAARKAFDAEFGFSDDSGSIGTKLINWNDEIDVPIFTGGNFYQGYPDFLVDINHITKSSPELMDKYEKAKDEYYSMNTGRVHPSYAKYQQKYTPGKGWHMKPKDKPFWMKESNLDNIVKESIKKILNENLQG